MSAVQHSENLFLTQVAINAGIFLGRWPSNSRTQGLSNLRLCPLLGLWTALYSGSRWDRDWRGMSVSFLSTLSQKWSQLLPYTFHQPKPSPMSTLTSREYWEMFVCLGESPGGKGNVLWSIQQSFTSGHQISTPPYPKFTLFLSKREFRAASSHVLGSKSVLHTDFSGMCGPLCPAQIWLILVW